MQLAIDGNEANVSQRVGSNVFAFEVIKRLPSLLSDADSATLFLKSAPVPDIADIPRLNLKVVGPSRFWTRFRFPLELVRRKNQFDLLYVPGHYSPRPCPIKSVISIMDLAFFEFSQDFLRKDYHQLVNWTKHSINQTAHIIAISAHTKTDIIKRYHYPAKQITVSPLSHNRSLFHPKAIGSMPAQLSSESRYVLYVGTLQPRKNIQTLIKAFAQLAQTETKTQLVIAGKKGWLYEDIFSLVHKYGLHKRVIFTGFVTQKELVWLYRHARCFVLPSLYEGFGIPVLEAMACGCPVIISRVSSLPEVGGSAAIYLDDPAAADLLADLLVRTLNLTPPARRKLIAAGLAQANKFSWNKTAAIVHQVLKNEAG